MSLQYGASEKHFKGLRKRGVKNVILDDKYDSLSRFEEWLVQVKACDKIVSIANTTIHAAGGLGVPTMCLLSRQFDWRWCDEDVFEGCYWYPSVKSAREDVQEREGSWTKAITTVEGWVRE